VKVLTSLDQALAEIDPQLVRDDFPVVAVILVAAGSGERLAAGIPKAFVEVGGVTLLEHAVSRVVIHPAVRDLVVAAPAELVESARAVVVEAAAGFLSGPVVVPGGRTRQESVARGLAALADDVEFVLVHDMARAFVPSNVVGRVVNALTKGAQAVVPTLPVTDTLRAIVDDGRLGSTVDRSRLAAVQTPQGFARSVLVAAHAASAGRAATDDASLVEAAGVPVVSVPGAPEAFKVTVPLDLRLAELLAEEY
jgi:2-C-methyl-D-erythritol 4-phosphate cytidylyltransferase/2-C-methyl-D-erythritol 2,4-cyclodiphosphate synthase